MLRSQDVTGDGSIGETGMDTADVRKECTETTKH